MTTLATEFVRARSANATDASFPSRVPTTTEPAGAGVLDLAALAGRMPDNLLLVPFGTGNDGDAFNLRVIGWRKVAALWVPVLLAEIACTLSAAAGVAGAAVTDSERFADALSLTTGNANVSAEVISPGGDLVAHALIDVKGFARVELTFAVAAGATGMNALYCTL